MKQTLATDAVKLTASKIITMSISMLSAMLLSRFRSLEEYGTYSQLLLVVNLITTVFMLGLPNSINFFLARAKDEKESQKFLSIYYSLSTILSLISGFVLILGTPLIVNYFNNSSINSFIYVLAILPWANIILASIENVLIVYKKTTMIILFRLLNSISLLVIILIVELYDFSFAVYMELFIILEALFAISVYLIVRNTAGKLKIFYFDKLLMKKILNFSIPLGFASVIGVLSVQLDKLIIGKFFSTEEVAVYSNAAREMPFTIIASSLTAVLMPKLVKLLENKNFKKAINLWGETIIISYIIICFCSIALYVFAPEVISFLYSNKYLSGVSVFRVYAMVLIIRFTYYGIILNSLGKTKFILYSSIASLVLNLILSYLLYVYVGFIGPAIATFITLLLMGFLQLIVTSISIRIPLIEIIPWVELFKITLLNIIMGYVFFEIKKYLNLNLHTGEILESFTLVIVWGTLYFFIMFSRIKQKWCSLNENI